MNHGNVVEQQYEELQYSRKNPPPSVSVADSRIDELDVTVEHIAAQLDFKKPDDFPSDDDYSDWQKNAISAMSYVRAEHKFLVQWVEKSAKVATLPRLTKNPTSLKEVKSLAVPSANKRCNW